jgi:hypothetical protein
MQTHPNQPPDLRDVTICAVDTINPRYAARALDISMSQCTFGDALLFTHEAVPTRARVVPIERIDSLEAYSAFLLKQLVRHISTPWLLVVQWDGYVLNASRWSAEFLQYDYIGARWPVGENDVAVGNGGFSLRSARLLRALANDRFVIPPGGVEDGLICDTWRSVLEAEYGIRYAPAVVADRFSYEYTLPYAPSFGFHGVHNMWRHVDDQALVEIIRGLDIRTLASKENLFALRRYAELRKFACMKAMYGRYRRQWSPQEIFNAYMRNGASEEVARQIVSMCESA